MPITDQCLTEHCKSHEYVEKTMNRLEEISVKLTEGQVQIITVVKDLTRLAQRVERLENNQDDIKKFMYKIGGVITAVSFIIPLAVTIYLKIMSG